MAAAKQPGFFELKEREAQIAFARTMNLFSNAFMSVALDDIPTCTYVLRILTRIPDLDVIEIIPQSHIAQLVSRDVILDILARDSSGRFYNIEIQRADTLNHKRRVRLYRSEIDSALLRKGTKVDDLPDLYVIYLSETDIFESGLAWDAVVQKFSRTGKDYDDGCHIIFANAENDEEDDISNLMKYFMTADPDDMSHGELSRRVHFLKRDAGGEEILCEVTRRFITEGKREATLTCILNLMYTMGWDVNKAMEMLKVDREDRPAYAAFIEANGKDLVFS